MCNTLNLLHHALLIKSREKMAPVLALTPLEVPAHRHPRLECLGVCPCCGLDSSWHCAPQEAANR